MEEFGALLAGGNVVEEIIVVVKEVCTVSIVYQKEG
jgi:hypothetical protein